MIYLVRHPETENNVANEFTGWENSEYSEEGKNQFNKIVEYFKDIKVDVFSSDLPRALNLGKEIASVVDGNIFIDELLREQNFKETLPEGSFEDTVAFRKRVSNWVDNNEADDIVIVSHAGTINEIVLKLLGSEFLEKVNTPRDVILKIETVKNENKLSIIQT